MLLSFQRPPSLSEGLPSGGVRSDPAPRGACGPTSEYSAIVRAVGLAGAQAAKAALADPQHLPVGPRHGTSCSPARQRLLPERHAALVDQRAGPPSARSRTPPRSGRQCTARRRRRSAPPRSPRGRRAATNDAVEVLLGRLGVRLGVQPGHELARQRALGVARREPPAADAGAAARRPSSSR